jgi:hypothetical protein
MSEPVQTHEQTFLHNVADAIDSAANRLESEANGVLTNIKSSTASIYSPKFPQKIVYSTCYTLSFGVCFPVFLVCRYVPKNNPLVRGMIDGGTAASNHVSEWITRRQEAKQDADEASEEKQVTESGSIAMAGA